MLPAHAVPSHLLEKVGTRMLPAWAVSSRLPDTRPVGLGLQLPLYESPQA